MDKDKQIWIFAGPNGSGKSTIMDNYIREGLCSANLICPDNFVKIEDRSSGSAYLEAAHKAEIRRSYEITMGHSFTFETVLSRREKLEFIRYAKAKGYFINIIYVSTEKADINIARVKMRVEQGGHDVPEKNIRRRYLRCMHLLPFVTELADDVEIYDNSGETYRLVAKKINKIYFLSLNTPKWVKFSLLEATNAFKEKVFRISDFL